MTIPKRILILLLFLTFSGIATLPGPSLPPVAEVRIEAETFTNSSGIRTEPHGAGNRRLVHIVDGDWVLYENIDLGSGVRQFRAKTRATHGGVGEGGWIEIRQGSVDGKLLGRCLVVAVDIDNDWEVRFTELKPIHGKQDIYLVFRADSPDSERLFELDWVSFSAKPVTMTGNPIIHHLRTADPSVRVWNHHEGDRIWMYASHDVPDATSYSSMDGYHVFSTNDLKNWTDHGQVLHSRDVQWGHVEGGFMWAPDAHYKDGKYYFYFPHKAQSDRPGWDSPWRIGVAVSDHPGGPFIPEPDYIKGTLGTDPAVFIDDDGQAYLFFGNFRMARLMPNMKELDHSFPDVDHNGNRRVQIRNAPPVSNFMEGAWMHKHGDRYYYSWKQGETDPVTGIPYHAHYAVSDRPDGVFEYMGPLNRPPRRAQNHHSIVEIDGQWYFFYHVGGPGPRGSNRRMVSVAYLNHNPDGTIDLIEMTPEGVSILNSSNQ
jgi:arabinoxylan arabinofuranohydrolase